MIRDSSCILCLLCFLLSSILQIVTVVEEAAIAKKAFNNSQKWHSLNPEYLQDLWEERRDARIFQSPLAIINALAWFSLVLPVCQTAYLLSAGGKRMLGLHVSIAALVLAGSMAELLTHLMTIGFNSSIRWVVSRFNLTDWGVSQSGNDGVGWRVIEILQIVGKGMILWVDAFEWMALALITFFIALSIKSNVKANPTFTPLFSRLSVGLAIFSFLSFSTTVFKLSDVFIWFPLSISLTAVTMLILLPIWLFLLSGYLPAAKAKLEITQTEESGEEVSLASIA